MCLNTARGQTSGQEISWILKCCLELLLWGYKWLWHKIWSFVFFLNFSLEPKSATLQCLRWMGRMLPSSSSPLVYPELFTSFFCVYFNYLFILVFFDFFFNFQCSLPTHRHFLLNKSYAPFKKRYGSWRRETPLETKIYCRRAMRWDGKILQISIW